MTGGHAKGPLRGASNFSGIMFNKIPFDTEVDARFYMILRKLFLWKLKMICFWVRTRHVSFRTTIERVKLFEGCHRERSKFKTDNYQTQIDLWQMLCLPLKKVLNIEFSQSSSSYLLKPNLSIACSISEASKCEAPNFFLNSANLITRTNSTGLKIFTTLRRYVQENELGVLKCIV